MPLDTQGFDGLASDIAGMAGRMDADGAGAPAVRRILEAAARPIHQQMKANASKDPKIITGDVYKRQGEPVLKDRKQNRQSRIQAIALTGDDLNRSAE